jgi:hypothetical protein
MGGFVPWEVFLKNTNGAQIVWLLFSMEKVVLIVTKKGWVTLWAIFSQTHLVTLFPSLLSLHSAIDATLKSKLMASIR